MKEIKELSLGSIDVAAISSDYVTPKVLTVRNGNMVLSQLFQEVQLPKGNRRGIIPSIPSATLTVNYDVPEGSTLSESAYSYNASTVSTKKSGIYIAVDKEAFGTSQPFLDQLASEMGTSLAQSDELRAQTVILDLRVGRITTWEGGTLGTSGLTPIIEIQSVSGATVSSVDYYDGKVLLTGSITEATVTFTYSNRCGTVGTNQCVDAINKGVLSLDDLLNLRAVMNANSIRSDVFLLNDDDLKSFLYDSSVSCFVSVRQYTDRSNVLNGEMGQIGDTKILVSRYVPSGVGILVDSLRIGYDVVSKKLWSSVENKLDYDQIRIRCWEDHEYAIGDTLSVGLVVNSRTGSFPAADM